MSGTSIVAKIFMSLSWCPATRFKLACMPIKDINLPAHVWGLNFSMGTLWLTKRPMLLQAEH